MPLLFPLYALLATQLSAAPAKPARPQAARPAAMIKAVPTSKKLIAFTFDDGPNRRYTPKVVELLKRYHAHATFFVIGQEVVRYPDVIQMLRNAGMEVGNHGLHHKYLRNIPPDAVKEDVTGGADAIIAAGGAPPYLYRLPAALSDDTSRQILGELRYTIVSWSVDTRDWRRGQPADRIAKIVMRDAAPGRIVIMHDGPAHRESTMQALSQVLPSLEGQGYRVVSVGELLRSSDFAAQRRIPPRTAPVAKPPKAKPRPHSRGWLQSIWPRRIS